MGRTWKYHAELVRVVDGDTVVCHIDQGMNHWARNQYVRLAGINAPELSTNEGQLAKGYLLDVMRTSRTVRLFELETLEYHEFEKYGRVLGTVTIDNGYGPIDVNELMLSSGHAVKYP